MLPSELAELVDGNAWTYGPSATSLRVLRLTIERGADPASAWEPLLAQCPRMAPLGYWRAAAAHGLGLRELEADFLRREELLVTHLDGRLAGAGRVLLAGHDREIEQLWLRQPAERVYRYLLLDGRDGVEGPGAYTWRRGRSSSPRVEAPFPFDRLEDALDWADAVVLAGFILHRQNLLGPPQLRPLLSSAREQVDRVLLCATNERRVTLGEGAPRGYREDFRPYLWQAAVTDLVSEWHTGAEGTQLGWLPVPPRVLQERFGEELFPA